jgi:hypothetical protein
MHMNFFRHFLFSLVDNVNIKDLQDGAMPAAFGGLGGIWAQLSYGQLINVAICAFLGALIGYFTKFILDLIFKRKR